MTDRALDVLSTTACDPKASKSALRTAALVAIGELSMLRRDYAQFRESLERPTDFPGAA
jgi:hypothetical protein